VIASYILGGLGLGCGCLTGIPAIVCASIAMKQPGQERHAKIALWVSIGCLIVGMVIGVTLQLAALNME
jgi:hypothetical protein